jgi:hypothetical protein
MKGVSIGLACLGMYSGWMPTIFLARAEVAVMQIMMLVAHWLAHVPQALNVFLERSCVPTRTNCFVKTIIAQTQTMRSVGHQLASAAPFIALRDFNRYPNLLKLIAGATFAWILTEAYVAISLQDAIPTIRSPKTMFL